MLPQQNNSKFIKRNQKNPSLSGSHGQAKSSLSHSSRVANSNHLVCWTTLCHNDVARHTTDCNTIWIQKLTIVFPTCTKVELEHSIAVKHLDTGASKCINFLVIYSTLSTYQSINLFIVTWKCWKAVKIISASEGKWTKLESKFLRTKLK